MYLFSRYTLIMKVLNFHCELVNRESKEVEDVSTTQQSPNSNEKFKGGYTACLTGDKDPPSVQQSFSATVL